MRFFIIALILFISLPIYCQKFYKTSGGELIFSRPITNSPFPNMASNMRISTFLHINNNYHYNFNNAFGIYSGISLSNIGFKYKDKDTTYKRRAYTLGVPLALKFGKLNNENYIFTGVELELPFHYKQKKLVNDQKSKYSAFFDRRVNRLLPSAFAGIQFSEGYCVKVRIYLSQFLNKDFRGNDFGEITKYKESETQLFLLSLSFNLKQNKIKKIIKNKERYALQI